MAGRPVHTFEVVRTEQLTSHMIRVVLGGSGFDTFMPSEFTDSYVKLVFVADDVDVAGLPQPLTLDSFRRSTGRQAAGGADDHGSPRRPGRPVRSPSTSRCTVSTGLPGRGPHRQSPDSRCI